MSNFIEQLRELIKARKKMTSPLYQVVLEGKATKRLLQEIHNQQILYKKYMATPFDRR